MITINTEEIVNKIHTYLLVPFLFLNIPEGWLKSFCLAHAIFKIYQKTHLSSGKKIDLIQKVSRPLHLVQDRTAVGVNALNGLHVFYPHAGSRT